MRTAALLALLLTAACGTAHDSLQGKWEFDPETLERLPFFQKYPEMVRKQILDACVGTIEFTSDTMKWRLAIHNWMRTQDSKTYKVVEQSGTRITIEMDDEVLGPRLVLTVTGKRLQFALGGRSFLFRRAK